MSAVVVRDDRITEALSKSKDQGAAYLGIFMRTDKKDGPFIEIPELITDPAQIYKVGCFAQVHSMVKSDVGTQLLLLGHRRINIDEFINIGPPTNVKVSHWKKSQMNVITPAIKAYSNELVAAARELIKLNPLAQEHMQQWVSRIELSDPFKLADFAAAMTTADGHDLQKVLECADPEERLGLALELINKEKEVTKLQKEISKQVEDKMTKQQREFLLREQLKSIKQELGMERDDKDELLSKYQEKIKNFEKNVDKEVLSVINEEMKKLSSLERNSPEFNVTRSYLDWLTCIPWGIMTEDRLHIKTARETLNQDHYGLDEVKRRILEFIAVGKVKGTVAGKIICLIGPPGVGKTSIAKSIASALNKSFYRFSVGGLTDIAEIKGHRRTYIGAMPGKPIRCLKTTQCINPLILIDEIDKLGRGYSGDPASALLELLDPNQNASFVDHYLDVNVDFSKVMFVCTANDEGSIPGPLRDRMEIIRISGYDIPEKVSIAKTYLLPKALKETGLDECKKFKIEITDDGLETLVKNYCRESGVRSLEKHVEKIVRKIAFNALSKDEAIKDADPNSKKWEMSDLEGHIIVNTNNIEEYVGKPKFLQDTIYEFKDESLPPGIVMGLAWNPLGGSPIFIETAAIPTSLSESGGGVNVITGQLGSVMKESVNIAYTYARKFVAEKDMVNTFFKSHQLHLHVPEGAVEKDGPSAGVAMATSLISIATNKPVKPRVAMTGELSLTGKVLPVGGIKEKTLAARRSGAEIVILPKANKKDFDELPAHVKDNVQVFFVTDYQEVSKIVF